MSSQRTFDSTPEVLTSLSQWFTPDWLAREIVSYAGVKSGMHVLEPSAGGGAIVRALLAAGALVTAVEIDPAWVARLSSDNPKVGVFEANFLKLFPVDFGAFDLVVMNPPLDDGVGPEHVWHALQFAPRAVSVLRVGDMCGVGHYQALWRRAGLAGEVHFTGRPKFGPDSAKQDFTVVDVYRARRPLLRPPEWWG